MKVWAACDERQGSQRRADSAVFAATVDAKRSLMVMTEQRGQSSPEPDAGRTFACPSGSPNPKAEQAGLIFGRHGRARRRLSGHSRGSHARKVRGGWPRRCECRSASGRPGSPLRQPVAPIPRRIHVRRLSGQIEFWNDGSQELYGFTEQETLGKNAHEFLQDPRPDLHGRGGRHPGPGWPLGRGAGQPLQTRPDSHGFRPHAARAWRRRNRAGSQSGHDISERKQAEQALHDSQTRLAAIVDSIADGFYALDRQWRITT